MEGAPHTHPSGEAAVEAAVRILLRAVRTLRVYPADNATSQRALAELFPRLGAVLPLELEVTAESFTWQGRPVPPDETGPDSLAATLYRDGVRRIRLDGELAADEMRRLVETLAAPIHPDDLSEDYVTRLWEAELAHVRVAAVDPYLDLDLADDLLEGKGKPEVEPEDIGTDPELDVPPPPDEAFRISAEDAAHLAAEVAKAADHPPWASFVAALFETLESPVGRARLDDVVPLLEASFQRLVDEGRVVGARKLVERLRSHVPTEARPELRKAAGRMVHPDRLEALHRAVEAGESDLEAVEALLLALCPLALETVCGFLARAGSDRARRFYARVLEAAGPPALPHALRTFRSGGEAVQMALARVLGGLHDPGARTALLTALGSPTPMLRREIVRALALEHDAAALGALLDVALQDPDAACRVVALRGLGEARAQLEHGRLLDRVRSREFASLPDEEKDLLFLALGAIGSEAVVPYLAQLLTTSWIPGRRGAEDWRRAASALAHAGTDQALAVLERAAKARHPELSEIAATELQRVRRAP